MKYFILVLILFPMLLLAFEAPNNRSEGTSTEQIGPSIKSESQVINSNQLTESNLRGLVMEDIDPF
ncbi:MAG: hypothetical protein R2820_13080 [Cyclobacteriaceae bacterium]|nr:hypothetical protein [Cyclobacteriaceae bacterium]